MAFSVPSEESMGGTRAVIGRDEDKKKGEMAVYDGLLLS